MVWVPVFAEIGREDNSSIWKWVRGLNGWVLTERENEGVPRRPMEVLLSDPSQRVSLSWSQMTTAEANLESL